MRRPKVTSKPAAPSVRDTVGPAIEWSRGLPRDERPKSDREVVRDILEKLDLPKAVRARLKDRHRL